MSAITLSDYVNALARSGLCDEPLWQPACDKYLQSSEPAQRSAAGLASFLASRGLVTPWQNAQLLQGRYKGFRLGKYKLLEQLGRGGMAGVYLAEDSLVLRKVALKVLPKMHASGPSSHLARFQREAKALAMLHHPNVVRVYDIDVHDETHYIAMEYIHGVDLQRLVAQRGALTSCEAADYIRQAAAGLGHAHERQLVHRDVKPANLLLEDQGAIKLLDLGVARIAGDESSLTVLHDDRMLGTADFIAPEQALDSHTVGPAADVYSLGCTLYFLLAGHPPFHEGTAAKRLLAHQMHDPPDLQRARRAAGLSPIDAGLAELCQRMLAKRPKDRPTAAEMQTALAMLPVASHADAVDAFSKSSAIDAKPPTTSTPPAAAPAKGTASTRLATAPFAVGDTRVDASASALVNRDARPRPGFRKAKHSRPLGLLFTAATVLLLVGIGAVGAIIAYQTQQENEDVPTVNAVAHDQVPAERQIVAAKPAVAARNDVTHDEPQNIEPPPSAPVVVPSESPIEANGAPRYYVVGTSKKYHRAGCRYVTAGAREIDAAAARANFQPCKVCKPDS